MNPTKTCTKCHETKPLGEFHNNKSRKDGKASHCKECKKEADKKSHRNHREERNIKQKKYYEKHKEEINKQKKGLVRKNRKGTTGEEINVQRQILCTISRYSHWRTPYQTPVQRCGGHASWQS